MAYVPLASAAPGTRISLASRGKIFTGTVTPMPFVPHRYQRKGGARMTVYYTKEHEWVSVEGDSATVGITDFAQGQLGDVVFVEVPEAGPRGHQGRRGGGGRIGQGGVRRLCAGQRHGDRGQSGGGRRAQPGQHRPGRRGLVLQAHA